MKYFFQEVIQSAKTTLMIPILPTALSIIDSIDIPVCITGLDLTIQYANRSFRKISEEIENFSESPDLFDLIKKGESIVGLKTIQNKNLNPFHLEIERITILKGSFKVTCNQLDTSNLTWTFLPLGPFMEIEEIKDRCNLEKERCNLEKERSKFLSLDTKEAFIEVDLIRNQIHLSGNFKNLIGDHKEVLTTEQWQSLIHPEDTDKYDYQTIIGNPNKVKWIRKFRIMDSNNQYIHVLETSFIVRNNHGKAVRIIGSVKDIEKKMQIKKKLNESYQRLKEFRSALDQSTNLLLIDTEGIIVDANHGACQSSGYSKEELVGSHTRIYNSGYHDQAFFRNLWETVNAGKDWRGTLKNKRKDGSYYWEEAIIVPLLNENKVPHQFLAVRIDITKQKEAEEKLIGAFEKIKSSEKKYSHLFKFSPVPMWVYDIATKRFLDVNLAAQKQYGYTKKEFLNMTIMDIRPADTKEKVLEFIKKRKANKIVINQPFVHENKSGDLLSVEISSIPMVMDHKSTRLVVSQNATERTVYLKKIETQNEALKKIAWIQCHVVRAPLARILGLIEFINEKNLEGTDFKEIVEHLKNSGNELDKAIREMVDNANYLD